MIEVPSEEGQWPRLTEPARFPWWCACAHTCVHVSEAALVLCPSSSVLCSVFIGLFSLITFHRNHGSEIVKVEFLIHRFKKTGYFLTVTKDGFLQSWSESFVLIDPSPSILT